MGCPRKTSAISRKENNMTSTRKDIRNRDPQGTHRAVFMGGWTDAINGKRYATIDTRKTHANMGNLFGWIFGAKPQKFKDLIWTLYIGYALDIEEK
jgi:hypothetical protein